VQQQRLLQLQLLSHDLELHFQLLIQQTLCALELFS
jgi:hypothetical protein